MHHKTQSIITVSALLLIMGIIGFSIGSLEESITGSSVAPACKCIEDSDCNDNNPNTEDICVNKEDCQKAYCIHRNF